MAPIDLDNSPTTGMFALVMKRVEEDRPRRRPRNPEQARAAARRAISQLTAAIESDERSDRPMDLFIRASEVVLATADFDFAFKRRR